MKNIEILKRRVALKIARIAENGCEHYRDTTEFNKPLKKLVKQDIISSYTIDTGGDYIALVCICSPQMGGLTIRYDMKNW